MVIWITAIQFDRSGDDDHEHIRVVRWRNEAREQGQYTVAEVVDLIRAQTLVYVRFPPLSHRPNVCEMPDCLSLPYLFQGRRPARRNHARRGRKLPPKLPKRSLVARARRNPRYPSIP